MAGDCFSAWRCCPKVEPCCGISVRTKTMGYGFVLLVFGLLFTILEVIRLRYGLYLTYFAMAIDILLIIASILLLLGIFQEIPWLIRINLISIILMIVLWFALLLISGVEWQKDDSQWFYYEGPFFYVIYSLMMMLFLTYCFIFIISYHNQSKEEEEK